MDVNILFMVLTTLIPDTQGSELRGWRLPGIWDEEGCQDCQDTARVRYVHWTRGTRVTREIWGPGD